MILPALACQDLDALTDELALVIDQISDEHLRVAALAKLIELSAMHQQVVGAFDRTVRVATAMARNQGAEGEVPSYSNSN